jgi:hypothetical protein
MTFIKAPKYLNLGGKVHLTYMTDGTVVLYSLQQGTEDKPLPEIELTLAQLEQLTSWYKAYQKRGLTYE